MRPGTVQADADYAPVPAGQRAVEYAHSRETFIVPQKALVPWEGWCERVVDGCGAAATAAGGSQPARRALRAEAVEPRLFVEPRRFRLLPRAGAGSSGGAGPIRSAYFDTERIDARLAGRASFGAASASHSRRSRARAGVAPSATPWGTTAPPAAPPAY